jgi:hypothetical protein
VVHEVGHAEDSLGRDVEVVEEIRVAVGRSRLGDRLVVVDVEREPDGDSPPLRLEERARDELGRLLLEVEVVQCQVEGRAGGGEEVGRELGDLQCALTSVRQGADFDVRRSREP